MQGRLALDAKGLGEHVSGQAAGTAPMDVRQLAQHQNGLRPRGAIRLSRAVGERQVERPTQVLFERAVDELGGFSRYFDESRLAVLGLSRLFEEVGQHHLQLGHQGRPWILHSHIGEGSSQTLGVAGGETPRVDALPGDLDFERLLDRLTEDPGRFVDGIRGPRVRGRQRPQRPGDEPGGRRQVVG